MVTNRRIRRNRLGQFMRHPTRAFVHAFPRQGHLVPLHGGEYDRQAPTGETVCNISHDRCFHQGVGTTVHEAMMNAHARYIAAHGGIDRAPSLVVAPRAS